MLRIPRYLQSFCYLGATYETLPSQIHQIYTVGYLCSKTVEITVFNSQKVLV